MLTFRTTGAWGAGKGSNLTPEEVDENFWEVWQASQPNTDDPAPVGIANITVTGSLMTVVLDDATELGPFNLPFATFIWRGTWAPDTGYGALNVVRVQGLGVFLVIQTHTSAAEFDPLEETTDGLVYRQIWGVTSTFGAVRDGASTEYMLLDTDFDGGLIRFPANCLVDVPLDLDVPVGSEISFEQGDDVGHVQVTGLGGVTIHTPFPYGPRTAAQWATITLRKVADNEYTLRGYLDESGTGTEEGDAGTIG